MKRRLFVAGLIISCALGAQEKQHEHMQTNHQSQVNERGDHVMGFSHEKTTHHFRLFSDGGSIEVEANYPKDTESREQIQMHLSHIAQMFAAGNFKAPMLIHDRVPPGVPVLEKLKDAVTYRFEKTDRGGRVRIATQKEEALRAVHDFLRFQITDHRTGDPIQIVKP